MKLRLCKVHQAAAFCFFRTCLCCSQKFQELLDYLSRSELIQSWKTVMAKKNDLHMALLCSFSMPNWKISPSDRHTEAGRSCRTRLRPAAVSTLAGENPNLYPCNSWTFPWEKHHNYSMVFKCFYGWKSCCNEWMILEAPVSENLRPGSLRSWPGCCLDSSMWSPGAGKPRDARNGQLRKVEDTPKNVYVYIDILNIHTII